MIGDIDKQYWAKGKSVVGFDEAGRGPIAGDMFLSLVELYPLEEFPFELKDSKGYKDNKRLEIEQKIIEANVVKNYTLSSVTVEEINTGMNLNRLLHHAVCNKIMQLIAGGLQMQNMILLVDGNQPIKGLQDSLQHVQPKLDTLSWSCAVASIFAKNAQVRSMHELDKKYPEYGFTSHKGYAKEKHYEAIKTYGTCEAHRVGWIHAKT